MNGQHLFLPKDYTTALGLLQTQNAIKLVKDDFERRLAKALNLTRVSAPMFVRPETGLNDNLSGVERAVSFDVPSAGCTVEVVHSLAKWKRYALGTYGFEANSGLYTDMNAIRRDESLDNLHSIYVDQWDWEKIITREQRSLDTLKDTVSLIVKAIYETQNALLERFPDIPRALDSDRVFFITSEQLCEQYPGLSPKQREDEVCKQHGVVFVIGIGAPLLDGRPHDSRAPDYDDWALNGDILVWYPLLNSAVELSSMGVRVDAVSLRFQLEKSGQTDRLNLPFHKAVLDERLPLTIGGGIGQSRLCMVLLGKAHIGEVQASVWGESERKQCEQGNITLL